jgi:DNA segregation ATPase FtsK/SpoIIIE-like protein
VSADIKRIKAELKAATMPPSIPASETSSGGEGAEKAKPGKTAPARKPKLNASEAMSGIAAAMQSVEASTSAPDGAVASTSSSTTEAAVDPLLASAKALVVRQQKASVRLLKSELSIGTTKALALMDQLEQASVVSAVDQRGAREVLVAA